RSPPPSGWRPTSSGGGSQGQGTTLAGTAQGSGARRGPGGLSQVRNPGRGARPSSLGRGHGGASAGPTLAFHRPGGEADDEPVQEEVVAQGHGEAGEDVGPPESAAAVNC